MKAFKFHIQKCLRILTNNTAGTAEIYACGDMLPVGTAAQ